MRIALLTAEYPPMPGGVGDYTRRLGVALAARDHDVHVWTIATGHWTIYELCVDRQDLLFEGVSSEATWGWRVWKEVIGALHYAPRDLLHIQYQTGAYGMHPAVNFLPWRLRGLPHRPSVAVTAHDLLEPYLFPKAGPLRSWVTRRLLADADAAVVTNEDDYARLSGVRRPDNKRREVTGGGSLLTQSTIRPAVIPIGSNIPVEPPKSYARERWREKLSVQPGETLVAYFGLLSRSKGLDVLLHALARLPGTIRLLLVGGEATLPQDKEYAAEIEQLIATLGLRHRIIQTGHVGEDEVSGHLLACDLAALPFADGATFRRGSLLAALAHGLPVVTTQPPAAGGRHSAADAGLPRLVDNQHVLLTPAGDVAALEAAMHRLINDVELRRRLGDEGRTLASRFSWETIAAQHETLYNQLAAR